MENDDALEGRLYTRRETLAIARRTGLMIGLGGMLRLLNTAPPAYSAPEAPVAEATDIHLLASPSLTEGPFFVDERLQRADLTGGSIRPSIVQAVPLQLTLNVFASTDNRKFAPLPGATVDVWHVDAHGVYSDEPQGLNPEDTKGERWLRGYQVTDARGKVAFRTIFPGWYRGRTTHIHFKVRYLLDGKQPASFTSQLFVPDTLADRLYQRAPYFVRTEDAMRNQDDPIYRDGRSDGTMAGAAMTLDPKPLAGGKGYTAQFNVALWTPPRPSNNGRSRNAPPPPPFPGA